MIAVNRKKVVKSLFGSRRCMAVRERIGKIRSITEMPMAQIMSSVKSFQWGLK